MGEALASLLEQRVLPAGQGGSVTVAAGAARLGSCSD